MRHDLKVFKNNTKSRLDVAGRVEQKYAVAITPHVQTTIKGSVSNDPVAKQYMPQLDELKILPKERADPIGDFEHTPVKGLVHRHPNRVLFKVANVCAVYCRFCFRREMIGPGQDILTHEERVQALSYIREHPEIEEVIFTGGDPLILSPRQLGILLDELDGIDHVNMIRFHTRVPVADPGRITDKLLQVLDRKKSVYVVVHINHKQEITEEVKSVFSALDKTGCMLLSQSVLLKGVNDSADTLANLFKTLVTLKVKPYYIHHPDLAPGTSHFRLSIERGQTIMRQLRARISGICMPQYMLDIPGGFGKVPLENVPLDQTEDGSYLIKDQNGVVHRYPAHVD